MKLSVVIVNYNVKYYLAQCLDSLLRSVKDIEHEVIVVDNHSHDGSVEYLCTKYPEVRFVASNHNLGFAKANNVAIRQSKGEYILLLNPDTIVGENTIKECLSFLDSHPSAGSVGVKMLKADGEMAKESRRGFPTPMTAFYKMIGLCSRFPKSRRFGKYYMGYLPCDEAVQIEVVSGAYCMIRKSALDRVGLLDEDFFMYGEDIDLSYRILKGGYENWYLPCEILHYKGESTHKSSFRYVHVFYDAMLIFFRKHYGHLSLCLTIPVKAAIYFKAFTALVAMSWRRTRKILGFVPEGIVTNARYVFFCLKENLESCSNLVECKGLQAEIRCVDDMKCHAEQHDFGYEGNVHVYAVYDIEAYNYSEILGFFSSNPIETVSIGTYNAKERIVITPDEIITTVML